jgi:hypothetical protein
VGHFPVRYTFAVRALQSAWLANFKTPLAWPAGRGPVRPSLRAWSVHGRGQPGIWKPQKV